MRKIIPASLLLLLIAGAYTSCKKYDGEKAAQQRAAWVESLNDSITQIAARRTADSLRIEELRASIAEGIQQFTQVANPREVEPYYILSGFRSQYPLSGTGIAARMTSGEQAELIAALRGRQFDAIRVSADGQSLTSATVPPDQALNYTSGGLTTVAFTGGAADSICALIRDHSADPITLEYLRNNTVASSITLTPTQKEWVGRTWAVCGAHKEARQLEARQLTDSRKIELLRLTIAAQHQE